MCIPEPNRLIPTVYRTMNDNKQVSCMVTAALAFSGDVSSQQALSLMQHAKLSSHCLCLECLC